MSPAISRCLVTNQVRSPVDRWRLYPHTAYDTIISHHREIDEEIANNCDTYSTDNVDDNILRVPKTKLNSSLQARTQNYRVAQKTGPPYLIANILKIP